MYPNNPEVVMAVHKAHVAHLAQEYAAAQADAKYVTDKANQLLQFVRTQVQNLTSGMNQGNSGTLLPSA